MSELINNSEERKKLLKHLILQLHEGVAPEEIKKRLMGLMSQIPYGEVVEVEQALISEGKLPVEEIQKLCDIHAKVLEGSLDHSAAREVPTGHPVDILIKENKELQNVINSLQESFAQAKQLKEAGGVNDLVNKIKHGFNQMMDVDKHYRKKENLLFPYLEKHGITGPSKVMWGKDDEVRDLLKGALEALGAAKDASPDELRTTQVMVLKPVCEAVAGMIMREEEILFPMMMDKLTDMEWYDILGQFHEIGYCLYDPKDKWEPQGVEVKESHGAEGGRVQLPSGSFSVKELMAILNTLPVDITFVDKDDKVSYFSQGRDRIFDRNRSILKRDVRLCHPPSSVNIVEKIVEDFKSGKEDRAPFWIQMRGKFIHIEYFALRDENGEYLGTLEVSQDLTAQRKLEGEQRILSYTKDDGHSA